MYDKIFGSQHRVTVLRLYKTILRLHQSLPNELRELGTLYVRDEFRRHKTAQPEFVTNFMVEWSVSRRRPKLAAYSSSNALCLPLLLFSFLGEAWLPFYLGLISSYLSFFSLSLFIRRSTQES